MKTTLRCLLSLALATGACTDEVGPGQDPASDPAPAGEVSQAVTTTSFTGTYVGQGSGSSTCNTTFNITGQEPSTTGTFPVFVYMVGTSESFTNASATAAVAGMASRGFVAATVAYDSGSFNNCSVIQGKARCIFNPGASTSAISVLCGRAKADCSKGIVVGGFSQGAVMATQSKNFDARIAAAWGMGDGVRYTALFDLTSCQGNGNRALPSSRLRAVVGQRDQFVGDGAFGIGPGSIGAVRNQLQTLTGFSCGSTAVSCLQSNGSGWYIVQNGQVQDGSADHCYMRRSGDCSGSQNSLDAGWQGSADPWELSANLDWLTTFTTP